VLAMPGQDGALMIDGGLAANADALLATVKSATRNTRVHTLINTHGHPEQVGANEAVGKDGGVILAHEKTLKYLSNTVDSVTLVAVVSLRLTGGCVSCRLNLFSSPAISAPRVASAVLE